MEVSVEANTENQDSKVEVAAVDGDSVRVEGDSFTNLKKFTLTRAMDAPWPSFKINIMGDDGPIGSYQLKLTDDAVQ